MGFSFIDLFAGIGGIRIAFEAAGGKCVFSSEWDRYAQKTYAAFFGEQPTFEGIFPCSPPGDITQLPPSTVPDHAVLTGGFPCQPFSLAGVSKKNSLNRPHGFDDPTQGTLFFTLKEIIKAKQPKAFLLENVKHLLRHDSGNTFKVIEHVLRHELKYNVRAEVIDACYWVPQHRERIYIIGFHQSCGIEETNIRFPAVPDKRLYELPEVLEQEVDERYTLGVGTWKTLEKHRAHHSAAGNGFGYGLIAPPFEGKTTRTLSARYHKDGAEILIDQGAEKRPRRLTPLECSRLMGFPQRYQAFFDSRSQRLQPVSDTQAYKQFGNSVVVPVISAIARTMISQLEKSGVLEHCEEVRSGV